MDVTVQPMLPAHMPEVHWLEEAKLARLGWLLHTPYATVLQARIFDELVGVAGLLFHGTTTLVDLVELHPDELPQRIGPPLFQALLAACTAHGHASQLAYVPPEDMAFFASLGFKAQGELCTYTGGRFLQATSDNVVRAEPSHWLAILHQDRQATGEERGRWLREHDYLNVVYAEQHRVRGFLLSLLRNALIVADTPEVGLELQRWQFPIQEHLIVPAANMAACAHLTERGYRDTRPLVRLVRGEAPPWRPERIYAMP